MDINASLSDTMDVDLDEALTVLNDLGWKETSFVYYDGVHSIVLVKGNKKMRIECEE